MRVGIVGGSIAGCAAAALLHRAGHDVIVFERSGSDLVSRGAGIGMPTAVWQDMMAHGLIDETLPACRTDYIRYVTRGSGTGGQRWLGDVRMSLALVNWAHLYQGLRRGVPDELYRSAAAVERIQARPDGTTLHLRPGGSVDFDLVVCADGYRSMGRTLIDPDATPRYRGMVVWRGLLPESDLRVDPLDGCDGVRPMYQGGHGLMYYVPGPGQSTEPGQRLLMWGYYLRVPQSTLASVLVDDQERQQSSSVPFGKVHPQVRGKLRGSPGGPAAPAAIRTGAAERQLRDPCPVLRCAPQLRPRSSLPGRRRRCRVPPVHGQRRPEGGGQCHLTGRRPSPAPRPLMMPCTDGVRPSSRSLLR